MHLVSRFDIRTVFNLLCLFFRRFWVIESDSLVQGDSVEEEAEQHLETGSEEVDLKEEVRLGVTGS